MTALDLPVRAAADAEPPPTTRQRPRTRGRRPDPGRLVAHLVLASYCLTTAGSFVWFLLTSVKSNRQFLTQSPWRLPEQVHLSNYADAWIGSGLGRMVLNSLYVTTLSVGSALVLSTMAAYVLARVRFRGREAVAGLLLLGMLLPPFAAMIPLYFLLQDLNLLGSLNGLILVYIANQIPLSVFVLRGFYADLPVELEEAAYLDGASAFQAFWRVVLPQTYPVLMSLVVLNALTIWNEFVLALVLLPDQEHQTVAVGLLGLAVQADYSGAWVQLFAGLVISSLPMLALFVIAQDRIARGIQFGGLKG